ncbi:MAG: hypothetical protein HYZ46_06055 [Nitrosomonadales bacterium]|nr:hypothetical protein [Nitrosomonadales bacterium]
MSTYAEMSAPAEDSTSRAVTAIVQPIEDIADIHNSPVITANPTKLAANETSITELRKLRQAGEARERHLRAQYRSRGLEYPVRFEGD